MPFKPKGFGLKSKDKQEPSKITIKEKETRDISFIPSASITSKNWFDSINLTDYENKDNITKLLSKIRIKESMSIINFGEDIEKNSRTVVDKMLNLNLTLETNLADYLKSISDKIKSTYQKRGFFDTIFGFDDRPTLKDILKFISKQEDKIQDEIKIVEKHIDNLEELFELSKNKVTQIEEYCVVLFLAANFYEQNRSSLDEISYSNVPLLSKRYSSFVELKQSLVNDPLVIYNSRLMYLNVISSYKTSLNSLIHDYKNQVNLEISNKNNSFKDVGKKIVSEIEKLG